MLAAGADVAVVTKTGETPEDCRVGLLLDVSSRMCMSGRPKHTFNIPTCRSICSVARFRPRGRCAAPRTRGHCPHIGRAGIQAAKIGELGAGPHGVGRDRWRRELGPGPHGVGRDRWHHELGAGRRRQRTDRSPAQCLVRSRLRVRGSFFSGDVPRSQLPDKQQKRTSSAVAHECHKRHLPKRQRRTSICSGSRSNKNIAINTRGLARLRAWGW